MCLVSCTKVLLASFAVQLHEFVSLITLVWFVCWCTDPCYRSVSFAVFVSFPDAHTDGGVSHCYTLPQPSGTDTIQGVAYTLPIM
jgi:hypothetical protein